MNLDRFKKKPSALDNAIEATIGEYMAVVAGDSSEATAVAANLETLTKIKHIPKKNVYDPQVISAVIAASASLAGILAILKYEQLSVLATKALPFIVKTKI